MSQSPDVRNSTAVVWESSICISVKDDAPSTNGKLQKLGTIVDSHSSISLSLCLSVSVCLLGLGEGQSSCPVEVSTLPDMVS